MRDDSLQSPRTVRPRAVSVAPCASLIWAWTLPEIFCDRRLPVPCSEYRAHTGEGVIVSRPGGSQNEHFGGVEKRSVKATKAVEQCQLSHRNLGRKERRRSRQGWQETARVCKRESQNSESAEGAVGEGESRKEECLKPPFVAEAYVGRRF